MLVVLAGLFSLSSVDTLWPLPAHVWSGGAVTLQLNHDTFFFKTSQRTPPSAVLDRAFERYQRLCFPARDQIGQISTANALSIAGLQVEVRDVSTDLQLGVSEAYNLSIPASSTRNLTGLLVADTVWGALRGLETFSQLIDIEPSATASQATNGTSFGFALRGAPIVIQDAPRFAWRGMLVDTARHFLPPDFLRHVIDSLAHTKFNTLHWHITDAQSFPLVVAAFPHLAERGAYRPSLVYTANDVAAVVAFARDRGVRVVPELDVPGHAHSWGRGEPAVVARCPSYAHNINNIPLSPAAGRAWEVLGGVLAEVAAMFPDAHLHTGGDEVVTGCWLEDPAVAAWMRATNLSTGADVERWFQRELQRDPVFAGSNASATGRPDGSGGGGGGKRKRRVVWQEVFEAGALPPPGGIGGGTGGGSGGGTNSRSGDAQEVLVEVWKDPQTVAEATAAGYDAITAAGWYLDRQQPSGRAGAGEYAWEDTWKDLYRVDPEAKNWTVGASASGSVDAANRGRVIGGEAVMFGKAVGHLVHWIDMAMFFEGEQVDATNFDSRVWPRACAVAERLWSPEPEHAPGSDDGGVNITAATPRLEAARCRLAIRGVGAGPIGAGAPCLPW